MEEKGKKEEYINERMAKKRQRNERDEEIKAKIEDGRRHEEELNIDTNSVLSALLRLPEVVTPTNDVLNDKDLEESKKVLMVALSELNKHREEEGSSLENDIIKQISKLNAHAEAIHDLEPTRMKKIREEIVN